MSEIYRQRSQRLKLEVEEEVQDAVLEAGNAGRPRDPPRLRIHERHDVLQRTAQVNVVVSLTACRSQRCRG